MFVSFIALIFTGFPVAWVLAGLAVLFTAIAIQQLVAEGRIDLDAPLERYLPEFELGPPPPFLPGASEWKSTDVTIRSMLTHHSGIPSDVYIEDFPNKSVLGLTLDEAVQWVRVQAPRFEPGDRFDYSNSGYLS